MRYIKSTLYGLFCFIITGLQAENDASTNAMLNHETKTATINITGNDKMQYNINSFTVPANYTIKIKLTNVGSLPKQAMAHNLMVLKQETDPMKLVNAAVTAKDNGFFPKSYEDKVWAVTDLLGPGESDTIEFKAPPVGEYTYLCTFPAHYQSGMKGKMLVKDNIE